MDSKQSSKEEGIYSVKDPSAQFWGIVFMVIVAIPTLLIACLAIFLILDKIGVIGATNVAQQTKDGFVEAFVLLICIDAFLVGIMMLVYYRLKAIWKGVELNLSTRTMSFPGGGIAANNITDYIKPEFLLQLFKRKTIDLDAISEIQQETIKYTSHSNNGTTVSYTHYIKFVGSFGAAHVRFKNEGKRDELYNAIRMANRMGTPVFAA